MIRLDQIHIERALRDYPAEYIRAAFIIDVKTCAITKVIRLNPPESTATAYLNARPEKLIRNRKFANDCREIIHTVHENKINQAIRLPITLPTPYPQTICTKVHFRRSPYRNTVLAVSVEDFEFLQK